MFLKSTIDENTHSLVKNSLMQLEWEIIWRYFS